MKVAILHMVTDCALVWTSAARRLADRSADIPVRSNVELEKGVRIVESGEKKRVAADRNVRAPLRFLQCSIYEHAQYSSEIAVA